MMCTLLQKQILETCCLQMYTNFRSVSFSVSISLPPFFRALNRRFSFSTLPTAFITQLLPVGVPRLKITDALIVTSLQITASSGIPTRTWVILTISSRPYCSSALASCHVVRISTRTRLLQGSRSRRMTRSEHLSWWSSSDTNIPHVSGPWTTWRQDGRLHAHEFRTTHQRDIGSSTICSSFSSSSVAFSRFPRHWFQQLVRRQTLPHLLPLGWTNP